MTPGARIQAAIDLLDGIRSGTPAERALTGWARRSRFAGSKDRAAVRDHVFQALRGWRSYASLGGAETGRGVMIGALRAGGVAVAQVFTGEGHAPAPLTPEEENAGQPPQTLGARLDLPDWIVPQFIKSFQNEAEAERAAQALRQRAPVMLRVNMRKSTRPEVIAALAADGVTAIPAGETAGALIVTDGARRVAQSRAYGEGRLELQDGASQAAMERLEIPDGCRILDYCAGGGGKVLALAGRAEGQWFAHDALPQRLKDLPERAARAGVSVQILDGEAVRQRVFDVVLCDVPCSGSGTWRRTPDAKWRLTQAGLDDLVATQDGILDTASGLVTPGGTLAYATCSVLRCENEDRISAFLSRHPGWTVVAQTRWPICDTGDGFFLAQLKREYP